MPVTLAQAQLNAHDDIDFNVYSEFRGSSALLDGLIFHGAVNAAGGGATLTYGYRRTTTLRAAAFRAINSEYTAAQAEKTAYSVDLKPLGGSYEIDRVLAKVARGAEVAFQVRELIEATAAKFNDEVVNGDTAVDADGFDGLDKALTGSDTELVPNSASTAFADWTSLDSDTSHTALDLIDEFLSLLDGQATHVLANRRAAAKLRAIARRANQYVREPVEGLTTTGDRPVVREFLAEGTMLVDLGDKPGTSNPVIPTESRDVADSPDAGSITGLTDIYAIRSAMDGFHAVATTDVEGSPGSLLQQWLPDFEHAGAVKEGEVELGPVATVLKKTRAAAVLRNIKVQ